MRWVLLGDLEEHSVREACQGAAAYAATRSGVDLDPCPAYPGRGARPTLSYLRQADGLLLAELDLRIVGGSVARLNRPCVFYLANAQHRRIPFVSLDEVAIGRMAAEHLIQRGYQHLAFFGYSDLPWSRLRAEGFRAAAAAQGRKVEAYHALPSDMQVYRSPWLRGGWQKLPHELESLPKSCGIFAAHDVGACYLIQAVRELGYRIPDQFGIIGVDDDPIANAAAGLAISTVQIPFREAGWRSAALLDACIRGKRPPNPAPLLPVRVVVRASTDAFMTSDALVRRAQALIEERRAEGVTVMEVVTALRTTSTTLCQRFWEHLKLTPGKYILHRRLEYAKDLLRAGQMSVAQVSDACHFHDCSYFCQIFKRATGASPGALRPTR
jgi:LacI family transcriptional regulator